ncbi:hypothetical protein VPH35_077162 [Triticum aestivum]
MCAAVVRPCSCVWRFTCKGSEWLQAEEAVGHWQRRIRIVLLILVRKIDSSLDLFCSELVQKCTDICFVLRELQDTRYQLQLSFICCVNQFVMASKRTWLEQSNFL